MKKQRPRGIQNPITDAERFTIIALHKGGCSIKEIAWIVKRHRSTVNIIINEGCEEQFFSWENFRKYILTPSESIKQAA